jgi:alkanesulfonate monooxygenase SsuD/methylene tetrahydromethanopterin reductase-like flavin-dependent oxidoreductase (luciferase family)
VVQTGLLMTDIPRSVSPKQQFDDTLRVVEAAQQAGFTHICFGQHFLYGDLSYLQPVPLLARLAAHVDPHVRLVTSVLITPLYHPVLLAEELATLDVVTEGRLIFGAGIGYRPDEFTDFGIPFRQRASRTDEILEVLVKLWTQDEVSHAGRYWTLDRVRPHLQPVQQPYPPIWIGAHSDAGARRAGRFADAFTVPPETTLDQVRQRFEIVRQGFAERGKPFGPQPLRRNAWVADTHEQAVDEYARLTQSRYLTYRERGLDVLQHADLRDDFEAAVSDHAVLGTPDEVAASLVEIVRTVPVDPILLRPQWPTMSADEGIASIRRMGREIIPALSAVEPLAG